MSDGSSAVVFATASTPAVALSLARETWKGGGDEPLEIRVYVGGKARSIGEPLVKWQA